MCPQRREVSGGNVVNGSETIHRTESIRGLREMQGRKSKGGAHGMAINAARSIERSEGKVMSKTSPKTYATHAGKTSQLQG